MLYTYYISHIGIDLRVCPTIVEIFHLYTLMNIFFFVNKNVFIFSLVMPDQQKKIKSLLALLRNLHCLI